VTFFTFEAGGVKGTTGSSAAFAQNIVSLAADRVRIENQQDSLTSLASETGGLAVLNANDLAPSFRRVAQALRNHYSLAFSPRAGNDGKEHRIKVKLAKRIPGGPGALSPELSRLTSRIGTTEPSSRSILSPLAAIATSSFEYDHAPADFAAST
jgi:hypothetical protein